jgi:hypothetical protein
MAKRIAEDLLQIGRRKTLPDAVPVPSFGMTIKSSDARFRIRVESSTGQARPLRVQAAVSIVSTNGIAVKDFQPDQPGLELSVSGSDDDAWFQVWCWSELATNGDVLIYSKEGGTSAYLTLLCCLGDPCTFLLRDAHIQDNNEHSVPVVFP